MKIELEIPDWIGKRTLMLLAGKELVAYRTAGRPWRIKKTRCNQCGECCMDYPKVPFGCDDEGKCNKLEKEDGKWLCRAGADTPKRCLGDPTKNDRKDLGCSIEYS